MVDTEHVLELYRRAARQWVKVQGIAPGLRKVVQLQIFDDFMGRAVGADSDLETTEFCPDCYEEVTATAKAHHLTVCDKSAQRQGQ